MSERDNERRLWGSHPPTNYLKAPAMTREQEIQERLGKATPGPWSHYSGKLRDQFANIIHEVQDAAGKAIVAWGGFDASPFGSGKRAANARFIAHAPDDITYLLARVKELEAWQETVRNSSELLRQLEAAQATNAQRDARLVRAGIEMAAKWHDTHAAMLHKLSEDERTKDRTDSLASGALLGQSAEHKELAIEIRALATDDASIQAAVEE
jgi:hypothetical protein